jgi:integrase
VVEARLERIKDSSDYASDRRYLKTFLDKEPALCNLRVPELTKHVVMEYIARRAKAEYGGPSSKPWTEGISISPVLTTLKREIAPLRVAFRYLENEVEGYLNPWDKCFNRSRVELYLGTIVQNARENRPLEYGEFGKLLAHCNDNNWSQRFLVLAMYIGFCAGMRRSEVLNMRYGDVNHNKDWITIPKEKIDKKRKARGEPLGRTIPIPMSLSLAILNLRYHVAKERNPDFCPPSALMRQVGWVEEGRISGSS